MRWQGGRRSDNVEDQRGGGPGRGTLAVGGGVGTLLLIAVVWLLGGDPMALLQQVAVQQPGGGLEQPAEINPEHEKLKEFVSVVLADTEDVWHELFRQQGKTYEEPKLVLFSGRVRSACGLA